MNRQSMTISCAMRLPSAPDRKPVSRAAVVRTMSAASASGELLWLVIAMVVAPALWASSRKDRVSTVAPEWDTATATYPGRKVVAACLLYTSDAADDLTRVDLGGRRIIKK